MGQLQGTVQLQYAGCHHQAGCKRHEREADSRTHGNVFCNYPEARQGMALSRRFRGLLEVRIEQALRGRQVLKRYNRAAKAAFGFVRTISYQDMKILLLDKICHIKI